MIPTGNPLAHQILFIFPYVYPATNRNALPTIMLEETIQNACGLCSRLEVKFIPKMAAPTLERAVEKVPIVRRRFIFMILFRMLTVIRGFLRYLSRYKLRYSSVATIDWWICWMSLDTCSICAVTLKAANLIEVRFQENLHLLVLVQPPLVPGTVSQDDDLPRDGLGGQVHRAHVLVRLPKLLQLGVDSLHFCLKLCQTGASGGNAGDRYSFLNLRSLSDAVMCSCSAPRTIVSRL